MIATYKWLMFSNYTKFWWFFEALQYWVIIDSCGDSSRRCCAFGVFQLVGSMVIWSVILSWLAKFSVISVFPVNATRDGGNGYLFTMICSWMDSEVDGSLWNQSHNQITIQPLEITALESIYKALKRLLPARNCLLINVVINWNNVSICWSLTGSFGSPARYYNN